MKATVIAIGSEIIKGFVVDSNSNFLSTQLRGIGVDLRFVLTVGDRKEDIKKALEFAYHNTELIITTGGLGPTADDLTRESVSEFLGIEFVLSKNILKKIQEKFRKYSNMEMPKANIKQAYIPKGGIVVDNNIGSAPGYIVEKNDKILISLPGVPQEMMSMFTEFVKSYLTARSSRKGKREIFVKIFGIPESRIDEIISKLDEVEYNTVADYGAVDIILYTETSSYEETKNRISELLKKEFGENIVFSISQEPEDIPSIVKREFTERRMTLSVAESMTGGYLSQILTSVPGATEYFLGGIVAYSDIAKTSTLGISEEMLNTYYATSMETTVKMAESSINIFKSDVAIAITGIAGPATDYSKKEVGTAYIAVTTKNNSLIAKELKLFGNREKIRASASVKAIELAIKAIRSGSNL